MLQTNRHSMVINSFIDPVLFKGTAMLCNERTFDHKKIACFGILSVLNVLQIRKFEKQSRQEQVESA